MSDNQARSKLLIPVLLALLFVGPFVTAIVLYYYGGDSWRPQGSVAHGVLIENPPSLGIDTGIAAGWVQRRLCTGKWSLLYTGSGNCGSRLPAGTLAVRQVRQALGRDMSRVQRFFIATSGTPDAAVHQQHTPRPDRDRQLGDRQRQGAGNARRPSAKQMCLWSTRWAIS